MSTLISSQCWQLEGIKPTQKLVLISLADQANDHGVCWPSMANMQRRTGLSERAVRESLRWLELVGILSTTTRNGTSNSYTIDVTNYDPAGPRQLVLPGTKCRPPRQQVPPPPAAGAGEGGSRCPQTIIEPSSEPSGEPSKGRRRGQQEDPAGFAEAWELYPKRAGDNPRQKAAAAWRARLAEGENPATLLEGTRRYADWCRLTGKLGTEYVKQASTFYGPQKGYLEDWKAPARANCLPPITGLRQAASGSAGFASPEDFLSEEG